MWQIRCWNTIIGWSCRCTKLPEPSQPHLPPSSLLPSFQSSGGRTSKWRVLGRLIHVPRWVLNECLTFRCLLQQCTNMQAWGLIWCEYCLNQICNPITVTIWWTRILCQLLLNHDICMSVTKLKVQLTCESNGIVACVSQEQARLMTIDIFSRCSNPGQKLSVATLAPNGLLIFRESVHMSLCGILTSCRSGMDG